MNILVVTYGAPAMTTGFPKRNAYLLRALAASHRVWLLMVAEDPESARVEAADVTAGLAGVNVTRAPSAGLKRAYQAASIPLRKPSVVMRNSPPSAGKAIRALLEREPFDAVVFQSSVLANHYLPAGPRVVIDEHNLEYELMERAARQAETATRRLHYALEAAALKPVELRLLARADLVSVTSEREREELRDLLPTTPVVVTPNGVDSAIYAPDPHRAEIPGRVIFTGAMDYHPNQQAALHFASAIWPLVRAEVPDATWYVVGARPSAAITRLASLPGVVVTGLVPRTQPYIADAAVAIAPLLVGGGTRLKILESLAMGKAMVTTALGCEGLDVTPGEHLLIADQPEDFAAAVVRLLRDDALRARLGAAGQALVERSYSWRASGEVFASAVEQVVAGAGSVRG